MLINQIELLLLYTIWEDDDICGIIIDIIRLKHIDINLNM